MPTKPKLIDYRLIWSPEGKYISTTRAKDAAAARRKAPMPYRKYLGEIYAEPGSGPPVIVEETPVVVVRCNALYRIEWYRNGNCFVSSVVNHTLTGMFVAEQWRKDDALPEHVRALAMANRPVSSDSNGRCDTESHTTVD